MTRRMSIVSFVAGLALVPGILPLQVSANEDPNALAPTRHISLFGSFGFLEFYSVGVSVQIAEGWSVGVVGAGFILGGGGILPAFARGYGIRGSYQFSRDGQDNFLWANVLSADVLYLFRERREEKFGLRNPGGIGIELIVGRDCAVGPGIGILWGAGIAAGVHSEVPPLLFPAFRLGLHIDV